MNIKVDFDNIVVKEDKNDFNVKVLMLKGEKGDQGDGENNVIEEVQVNGTALTVTNKTVNVPVPIVDSSISSSSTNPVQNKVIYQALGDKVDTSALNNYYEISEIDDLLSAKANTSALNNYYAKDQTYNKSETNALLNDKADASALETISSQVTSLASGSPLVASSTSEMTNTDKVYVNTSDGKWYYYDGNDWVAGGVYQATGIATGSITGKDTNFLSLTGSTNKINLKPDKWFMTGSNGTKIINSEGSGNNNFTFTCIDNILNITNYNFSGYTRLSQFIDLEPNTDYYIPFLNIAYNIVGINSKEIDTTGTTIIAMDTTHYLDGRTFNSSNYNYYLISFYGTTSTINTEVYINEGTVNLGFEFPELYKHNERIVKTSFDDLDKDLQNKLTFNPSYTQWISKKCSVIGSSLTANGGWTTLLKSSYEFDKIYNRGVGASTITNLNDLDLPNYYSYCFVYSDTTQYDESRDSVFSQTQTSGTYNCPAYYCSEGRINLLPADSELVIIDVGTNDFFRCRQLIRAGTKTLEEFLGEDLIQINYADAQTTPTYDETTFCGAMALAFKRIMTHCPNAKIICTAMPYNSSIATDDVQSFTIFTEIYRCIKKMCFIFGVPMVNTQDLMGVNEYNLYSYMEDGVHPYKPNYQTDKGVHAYYRAIESVVKNTYPIEE